MGLFFFVFFLRSTESKENKLNFLAAVSENRGFEAKNVSAPVDAPVGVIVRRLDLENVLSQFITFTVKVSSKRPL